MTAVISYWSFKLLSNIPFYRGPKYSHSIVQLSSSLPHAQKFEGSYLPSIFDGFFALWDSFESKSFDS